ncbi:hypothetical protein LHFGNBLO_001365 [Mesorhizobium sp. AR10]|uniref:hypothetical protein n=1 Tax=Mesorhizobium sp. AR10 TaxID=2865839 RepID=UPI00215E10EE|nr:hypothetical protein [Mesorhizobium sp. AR10]UVK39950.1 hypothetical protein LHFGNBLO_001365 [Mesorhizobium sp. AR10]
MSRASVKVPQGWGDDALTEYLDEYRGNQYATFNNKRAAVADLIKIDALFKQLLDGPVNPRPMAPMGFFMRAHSAYRAAAGAVMAGQLYEAQGLLRLCLEHGAYGFYIGSDNARWTRWLTRSDSEAAKKVVRNEFTESKIRKQIAATSAKLAQHFGTLYETLIDFGAHPNEQGFSLSTSIRRVDGNVHLDTIYLHGDGLPLDLALKTTAQVGLWVLHIAQLLYAARFKLLGIETELAALRQRY